jgi:hypothetical protein
MANGVMEVLIRPDAFFSRIFEGEVSLKVPGLIVIAGAIFSALTAYVAAGPTVKLLSGAAGSSASGALGIIGMVGAVFAFIFFILIWWLIMGGVFFAISAAFKGKGEFKRTLQATGYGLIPQVFSGVISFLLALYYIPLVKVPVLTSLTDPTAITKATMQLLNDPVMREYLQVTGLVTIIFLIWSANIWIFGMKHSRELSVRDAAITVGIPVAAWIIYTLATAMGWIGVPGAA